jgi:phosphatidylglycerol:prolipoprotein diacylglycerol transferase
MDNVAFTFLSFDVHWYSLLILLGVTIAFFVGRREFKRHNIDVNTYDDMFFYTVIIGIIGARIWYVLFNLDYYAKDWINVFRVWNGGLAIHGGLIFGSIFLITYCKIKKIDFVKVFDMITPCILIGQIIGRWGNFFNHEAHGREMALSTMKRIHLPQFIIDGMFINGKYYHPTFLYESIANLVCLVLLLILRRNKYIRTGTLVSIYLVWYGIVRFFVESLRTDSLMFHGMRVAQIISILFVILGIITLILTHKKERYNGE